MLFRLIYVISSFLVHQFLAKTTAEGIKYLHVILLFSLNSCLFVCFLFICLFVVLIGCLVHDLFLSFVRSFFQSMGRLVGRLDGWMLSVFLHRHITFVISYLFFKRQLKATASTSMLQICQKKRMVIFNF